MMRAVIVEDEPLAVRYLGATLEGTGRVRVVGEAEDGATGLKLCRELAPDVAFLDVELGGSDGLTLASRLLALPRPPLVVFVTGYAGHAVDAFRVEAVDYLLKPFDADQILESVRRLEQRLAERGGPSDDSGEHAGRVAVRGPADGVLRLIPATEIVALVRKKRRTWVVTMLDSHPTHEPLASVKGRLDEKSFLQVSRDAVVNLARIAEVRRLGDRHYEVVLRDAARTTVETSRSGASLLGERLRPA